MEFIAEEEGYLMAYTSNETNEDLNVFMDQMSLSHTTGPIVRVDDYYPFGLTFKTSELDGKLTNRFLYNGKEKEELTDWYDYGARMYQADIGRWGVIDSKASKYMAMTPYNYAINNPLLFVDPDGNDIVNANGKSVVSIRNGEIQIDNKANKSIKRVVSAMTKTAKGREIVRGMIESKTQIGIKISSKEKYRRDVDGTKKLLFGETDPGNLSVPGEPFEEVLITIFEGSFEADSKSEDGEFYGAEVDEFLNAIGVHEGTHSLNDPSVWKEFYDNCKKCDKSELESFMEENRFEENPDDNEETTRNQYQDEKEKEEDEEN